MKIKEIISTVILFACFAFFLSAFLISEPLVDVHENEQVKPNNIEDTTSFTPNSLLY